MPVLIRVAEGRRVGKNAFRLRPDRGEEGISTFDPHAADPPLTGAEILNCFRRPGNQAICIDRAEIDKRGLQVIHTENGTERLPERLRRAHMEIRPGPEMDATKFDQALKELEEHAYQTAD